MRFFFSTQKTKDIWSTVLHPKGLCISITQTLTASGCLYQYLSTLCISNVVLNLQWLENLISWQGYFKLILWSVWLEAVQGDIDTGSLLTNQTLKALNLNITKFDNYIFHIIDGVVNVSMHLKRGKKKKKIETHIVPVSTDENVLQGLVLYCHNTGCILNIYNTVTVKPIYSQCEYVNSIYDR